VLFFEFSYEKKSMLVIIKKAQVVFMWINTEIFALFCWETWVAYWVKATYPIYWRITYLNAGYLYEYFL